MFKKISTLGIILTSVILISGCTNKDTNLYIEAQNKKIEALEHRLSKIENNREFEARLSNTEDAAARAQARADESYSKADNALREAQKAQQTADEANERALRMLGNKVH